MSVGQQPSSSSFAPAQQQHTFTNHNKRNGGSQGNGRGFPQQPTMNYSVTSGGQQQIICPPPNPYKRWENWNYCNYHGGDVDDNHTSATCGKPGPMHNPNANCTNIMGGSVAGMHKTILPSTSGCTPPNRHPSSSSALSNVHPMPTTLLEARLGNNQPLPQSMVECHRPTVPTTSKQPWTCQCISPAKE
jgi:hypothetical protein